MNSTLLFVWLILVTEMPPPTGTTSSDPRPIIYDEPRPINIGDVINGEKVVYVGANSPVPASTRESLPPSNPPANDRQDREADGRTSETTEELDEQPLVQDGMKPNVTMVRPATVNASLHLNVPSGAYVFINGARARNRVWSKHRHFRFSGISPEGTVITVKVGLRKENCDCDKSRLGTFKYGDCCGYKLNECCKRVKLFPGDDEYLSFLALSNDRDEPLDRQALPFELIDRKEFVRLLRPMAGAPDSTTSAPLSDTVVPPAPTMSDFEQPMDRTETLPGPSTEVETGATDRSTNPFANPGHVDPPETEGPEPAADAAPMQEDPFATPGDANADPFGGNPL